MFTWVLRHFDVSKVLFLDVNVSPRLISTHTFRKALAASADEQTRGDKGCPHTPSISFRHLPPRRKAVVNQYLEFGVPLQWRNQLWQTVLEEGAGKRGFNSV